jgi:CCR4-NOT transcriptional regulation complex NOT5 subunit
MLEKNLDLLVILNVTYSLQQSAMITITDQAVIRHVGNVGRTSSVITSMVPVMTDVNLVTRETNAIRVNNACSEW